jgi:hypothetical protein
MIAFFVELRGTLLRAGSGSMAANANYHSQPRRRVLPNESASTACFVKLTTAAQLPVCPRGHFLSEEIRLEMPTRLANSYCTSVAAHTATSAAGTTDIQTLVDHRVLRLLYIDRSFAFSLSNSSGVRIPRSFSFSNSSRRWMRFMGGAGATGAAGGGA